MQYPVVLAITMLISLGQAGSGISFSLSRSTFSISQRILIMIFLFSNIARTNEVAKQPFVVRNIGDNWGKDIRPCCYLAGYGIPEQG